jgi:hypothetical protein
MLLERWKKCVDSGVEYVEDWHAQVSVWQLWFSKKKKISPGHTCSHWDWQTVPPSKVTISKMKHPAKSLCDCEGVADLTFCNFGLPFTKQSEYQNTP